MTPQEKIELASRKLEGLYAYYEKSANRNETYMEINIRSTLNGVFKSRYHSFKTKYEITAYHDSMMEALNGSKPSHWQKIAEHLNWLYGQSLERLDWNKRKKEEHIRMVTFQVTEKQRKAIEELLANWKE